MKAKGKPILRSTGYGWVVCPVCAGTGKASGSSAACPFCRGTGKVRRKLRSLFSAAKKKPYHPDLLFKKGNQVKIGRTRGLPAGRRWRSRILLPLTSIPTEEEQNFPPRRYYDETIMQNFHESYENEESPKAKKSTVLEEKEAEEVLEESIDHDVEAFEEQENPVGHESDEIVNTEVEYAVPQEMHSLEIVSPPPLGTLETNVFNNPFKAAQTLDFDPFAVNVNYDVVADPEEADPYDNGPGF